MSLTFCPNNPKHYYFVIGIKQEIYNIVYNLGKSAGRVSIDPGILHKATFEEAQVAIDSLGKRKSHNFLNNVFNNVFNI